LTTFQKLSNLVLPKKGQQKTTTCTGGFSKNMKNDNKRQQIQDESFLKTLKKHNNQRSDLNEAIEKTSIAE